MGNDCDILHSQSFCMTQTGSHFFLKTTDRYKQKQQCSGENLAAASSKMMAGSYSNNRRDFLLLLVSLRTNIRWLSRESLLAQFAFGRCKLESSQPRRGALLNHPLASQQAAFPDIQVCLLVRCKFMIDSTPHRKAYVPIGVVYGYLSYIPMDTTHNQSFRSLWMNKHRRHDHNYSVDKLKDNDNFTLSMPQFGNIHDFHPSHPFISVYRWQFRVHLALHCTALAHGKYSHNWSNRRACKGRGSRSVS